MLDSINDTLMFITCLIHHVNWFINSFYFAAIFFVLIAIKFVLISIEHFTYEDEVEEEAKEAPKLRYNVSFGCYEPELPEIKSMLSNLREGESKGDATVANDPCHLVSTPKCNAYNCHCSQAERCRSLDRCFRRKKHQYLSNTQLMNLIRVPIADLMPTIVAAEDCNTPDDDGVFTAAFTQDIAEALQEAAEASDDGVFCNDFVVAMKAALPL
ncbi:hypothetical protein EDC96DRAFT_513954 [Choanephora cucurbitarum]|nr:hypothetical protein EDC96DRAFT_513954 [Choanephora cucurbitarum]